MVVVRCCNSGVGTYESFVQVLLVRTEVFMLVVEVVAVVVTAKLSVFFFSFGVVVVAAVVGW